MSQVYDDALVTASAYPVSRLPSASDAATDAATRDAVEAGWRALADELARPPEITEANTRLIRHPLNRTRRRRSAQLNESPQAQEPDALGLSIVNPCFSIVSTKSILAPCR